MALSRIGSDIFNFENSQKFQFVFTRQSRSAKTIRFAPKYTTFSYCWILTKSFSLSIYSVLQPTGFILHLAIGDEVQKTRTIGLSGLRKGLQIGEAFT